MKKILITGAAGLIGSETSSRFLDKGWKVFGLDNNQRAVFFGPEADTRPVIAALKEKSSQFVHLDLDIRDREAILKFFEQFKPEAVVHAAGQPSHDLAASIPFDDFEINAVGTLNLLEATRRYVKDSPFVFLCFGRNKLLAFHKKIFGAIKYQIVYVPKVIIQSCKRVSCPVGNTPYANAFQSFCFQHVLGGLNKIAFHPLLLDFLVFHHF
jgi:NAD(P)-dependent dehydrogenase (short-subunit alcohol dehydrogenase family)